MSFIDVFIKRPVLAICINLLILVAGYQAIYSIATRQYPRSDLAVVTIKTAYVGASSDLVRGFVSTPLERVIASADGIDYLESSSQQGLSTITAHLRLNYDTNAALTQIQSKVAQVRNDLPPEAEAPVIDVETSDNRFASMYISFYSQEMDPNQITDYLMRVVQPKLSAVPGVQKADILGARIFAMRIWLKPERMAAVGISAGEVWSALEANNYLSALGATKGSMVTVNLVANTDLKTKEEFEDLVVKQEGDSLIRLRDVADVVLGAEKYDEDVRFSGQAATFMGVWVLPNANAIDVIKSVRAKLPEIEKNVPSGLNVGVPYDATRYINDAIHEVVKTLTETVIIVICVIFLFIGSLRSVLVPVVAIPLSLVGAAALMFLFGFSLNLLTLLAIVLAVGLVVDDAIVMLENVERHVAEGLKPKDAAIKAARELVGPIIAMTITLAAVYAPIGIQGGLTGALFREFAFTLAGAVVVSGFVALTLSPMMSAYLVRGGEAHGFKAKTEKFFNVIQRKYEFLLARALRTRAGVFTSALLIILCLPAFYLFSTKELAPREDQGVIFGIVQASPNSTLDQTLLYTNKVTEIYKSFPEFGASFQLTNPSFGFSGMVTKPWSERSRTTMDLEAEAWMKSAEIPGVRVIITTPPPLPGGSDFPIELVVSATAEHAELLGYAEQLVQAAFASGKFMFADADLKYDLPQTELVIDRERVAALGLDLRQIGNDIGIFTGGNYVNRFSIQGRSYKVIPQLKRSDRLTPEQLLDTYVSGPNGELILLSTIASIKDTVEPRQLNRFQQLNSVKVQGAVIPGTSIDEGLKVLEQKAAEILPPGYSLDYAGESRQLRNEGSALLRTLAFAVIIIYLVLAAQFESFRDPFIILAGSVPLALAGALSFVFLGATSMNIYSQVGLITLVGLIAKNGILIVEFANHLQEQGLDRIEAALKGASTRLRPVLMTSIATVVGHFPLVLAEGAGAGARNSIGIVLVTGMVVGTVFTLFVVPAIYTVIAKRRTVEHLDKNDEIVVAEKRLLRRSSQLAMFLVLFLISGCAVGPDYTPPEITVPNSFTEAEQAKLEISSEQLETDWWKSFHDPKLYELLERGVLKNKDVKIAVTRVKESRAIAREARSQLFPGLQVQGSYTSEQSSGARFPDSQNGFHYELWGAGIDLAWELDLFGGLRRSRDGRAAEFEGSIYNLADVLQMLNAEIASVYFQLRTSQMLEAITAKNIELQTHTLDLTQTKKESGSGSDLDIARAHADLSSTKAEYPLLKAATNAAIRRLSVLIGEEPSVLIQELSEVKSVPVFQGPIKLSKPEELLKRRPDLRVAERNLAAATNFVGAAIADLYPKISFTGNLGVEARTPEDLFEGAGTYSLMPQIKWTPFDNGTLKSRILVADAKSERALLEYEQAVLNALEETENALNNFSAQRDRRTDLVSAVESSKKALELAEIQYSAGEIDLLTVLDAQRKLLEYESEKVKSESELGLAIIGIYKALGGGWSEEVVENLVLSAGGR